MCGEMVVNRCSHREAFPLQSGIAQVRWEECELKFVLIMRKFLWEGLNAIIIMYTYIYYFSPIIVKKFEPLHPRVRKRNFPCHDDNVAFMQQVHSKTTGKQSVLLIVQLHSTTELLKNG